MVECSQCWACTESGLVLVQALFWQLCHANRVERQKAAEVHFARELKFL